MAIFNIQDTRLTIVREKNIDLEKSIQKLTEENLQIVFCLDFVKSEFIIGEFRLDTVAFDKESSSFVVIEYKRDKSLSIIDQGYTYLSLMLNNKADFVLLYNQQKKQNLNKEDIEWSQSRVMFLAGSFTSYQKNAVNFRDLPMELWEVKLFDNSTILYNQLVATSSKESIKTITKNSTAESVTREVKVYTTDDHVSKASDDIKNLFENIQEKILNLGPEVKEFPKKQYIAYKTSRGNFADVIIYQKEIRTTLNLKSGELDDPRNITTNFTKPMKGHWGNGDYEVAFKTYEEIPYVMELIEQAYRKSIK